MDEENTKPQSTSILELMYLIRAKNKGEMSFTEWLASASSWAAGVIAEHEAGQCDTTPPRTPTEQSAQDGDAGECQNCR